MLLWFKHVDTRRVACGGTKLGLIQAHEPSNSAIHWLLLSRASVFKPGHGLDLKRIGQNQFEVAFQCFLPCDRLPVDAGGFAWLHG